MNLVFFLEERSMKELLDGLLPRILPEGVTFRTIPHQGKSDLQRSLLIKLRAWNVPDTRFVIVHDQDSNDCVQLKQELQQLCYGCGKKVLIRIAYHELESWYWGDLPAVSAAFEKDLTKLSTKKKYRIPDQIENPKQELKRYLPNMGQIDGAHMNINYANHELK